MFFNTMESKGVKGIISLVFSVLFCTFTTVAAEQCSEGRFCKEISCISCDNERNNSDANRKICPIPGTPCMPQQTNICIKCIQWNPLNNSECETCPPGCKSCEQNLEEFCSKSLVYTIICSDELVGSATELYFVQCKLAVNSLKCTSCKSGFYGETCEQPCSFGCWNSTCDQQKGTCLSGCKPGFNGDFCEGCIAGKYGTNCSNNCPRTCKGTLCEQITGNCIDGCQDSKFGKQCEDTCLHNCEKCSSNTSCQTCSEGYAGYFCNDTCPEGCLSDCYQDGTCIRCKDGYYGSGDQNVGSAYTCNTTCPANCFRGLCSHTGSCYNCSNGFYGGQCEYNCSLDCCNGTCFQDGSCELCLSEKESQTGGLTAVVVFFVLAVLSTVVLAITYFKRKKFEQRTTQDEVTVTYSQMDMGQRELHQEASVSATSATPIEEIGTAASNVYQNLRLVPEHRIPVSKDVVLVDTICNLEVVDEALSGGETEEDEENEELMKKLETMYYNVYNNALEVERRRVPLDQLRDYIDNKSTEEMTEEFATLPWGLINSFAVSKREGNKSKNRYRGLYPYDKNRVVLTGGNGDYINASYVDGHKTRRAYIACIGPTEKHTDNFAQFWDMVWQDNVNTIVMLTNLFEHGFPKCEKYWPDNGSTDQYGETVVLGKVEEIFEEYVIRTFIVKKQKTTRVVRQVHFIVWPDKGVPSRVSSIVHLQREVRRLKEKSESPLLVHCSAGIGRTGTFIALYILTDEGFAEGYVDIYACVRNLREERVNMVQTFEQYCYLHEAVAESLLSVDNLPNQPKSDETYSNV